LVVSQVIELIELIKLIKLIGLTVSYVDLYALYGSIFVQQSFRSFAFRVSRSPTLNLQLSTAAATATAYFLPTSYMFLYALCGLFFCSVCLVD
jgi:hypothetical protein